MPNRWRPRRCAARAWDLGIELQFVPGTGPAGRITHADLDAYTRLRCRRRARSSIRDGVDEVPVVGVRRAIAEHLQQSKRRIPHFTYVEEIDVTALEDLRAELNTTYPERERLTLLPFLMRATVQAVAAHPQVNARYDDEAGMLHRHHGVHIGLATQTDNGLLVPVAHHAEALDLWQSAAELRRLAEAARAGKASRGELTGSTITITSLGRLGGIAATPVINYPEVTIIGVNRIVERPVVRGRTGRDPQDDEFVVVVRSPHRRWLGGRVVHPAHQAAAGAPGDAVHCMSATDGASPARDCHVAFGSSQ